MEVSGQIHGPALSGERVLGTNLIGDWVGPRAGLDAEKRKPLALTGNRIPVPGRPTRNPSLSRLPRSLDNH
jgi:hypothetical protein